MNKLTYVFACFLPLGAVVTAQEHQDKAAEKTAGLKVKVDPAAQVVAQQMLKAYGSENLAKLKSAKVKATVTIPAQNASMSQTILTKGEKVLMKMNFLKVPITKGFDGKQGWSKDSVEGIQLLNPGELADLQSCSLATIMDPFKGYDKVVLKGEKEFNNKRCYEIVLNKEGIQTTWYVNKKTYLKEGSLDFVDATSMKVKAITLYVSYAEHKSGFKYSNIIKVNNGMHKAVIKVEEIKTDVVIDDKVFSMPK